MAILRWRRAAILAKVEVTVGTDPTPTGADDAILANLMTVVPQPNVIETTEHAASIDVGAPIVAGCPMQINVQVYAKGSGAAGTAPEYGPLLQACSLSETIVATTSVTYAKASTAQKSITIYAYRDGIQWKFTGCRGTATLTMTSRGLAVWDFTFTGRFAGHADVALPSLTLDSVRAYPWIDGTFTIGGAAAGVRQFTLNLNNTVMIPDNPNDTEGFDAPEVTVRNVQGTMNPYKTLVATRNIFADFRAGTSRAIVAAVGVTAGNIMTVTVAAAVYTGNQEEDQEGAVAEATSFSATGADSGLSIAFT